MYCEGCTHLESRKVGDEQIYICMERSVKPELVKRCKSRETSETEGADCKFRRGTECSALKEKDCFGCAFYKSIKEE